MTNYALAFLSPLLLVRFLPVEDFGRYREFLTYATILVSFAGFSLVDSLLTFLPRYPQHATRIVDNTVRLVFFCSAAIVATAVALDQLFDGALFAGFAWPLALYILLFINLDFWELYWLSQKRPVAVFAYSAGRMLARMTVAVVAAYVSGDVWIIVWCLVALEAVRCTAAAYFWRRLPRDSEPMLSGEVRIEQWRFCLPWGTAIVVAMLSRNIGNVAVVKVLGASALALYAVGLYAEPIVVAIRNSISSVLLPEMVRREKADPERGGLDLWRRSIVLNCIVLFPIVAVGVRYAEPLLGFAFGSTYVAAAPVLKVYMIAAARDCFDLTLPFRARGQSRSFIRSAVLGLLVNALLLLWLVPRFGITGAAMALVGGTVAEATVLGFLLRRFIGATPGEALIPWGGVGRVLLINLVLYATLSIPFTLPDAGKATHVLFLLLGAMGYVLALRMGRVRELEVLFQMIPIARR